MKPIRVGALLTMATCSMFLLARPAAAWVRVAYGGVHRVGCYGCAAAAGAVAGVAIGAAATSAAVAAAPPPTTVVAQPIAALPAGCRTVSVGGVAQYQCGSTWYQPYFGGNGVYYQVVPPP